MNHKQPLAKLGCVLLSFFHSTAGTPFTNSFAYAQPPSYSFSLEQTLGQNIKLDHLLAHLRPETKASFKDLKPLRSFPDSPKSIQSKPQRKSSAHKIWRKSLADFLASKPVSVSEWSGLVPSSKTKLSKAQAKANTLLTQVNAPKEAQNVSVEFNLGPNPQDDKGFKSQRTKDQTPEVYTLYSSNGILKLPSSSLSGVVGKRFKFNFKVAAPEDIQVFSFEKSRFTWEPRSKQLTLTTAGNAELFIHYQKQLIRLPVHIEAEATTLIGYKHQDSTSVSHAFDFYAPGSSFKTTSSKGHAFNSPNTYFEKFASLAQPKNQTTSKHRLSAAPALSAPLTQTEGFQVSVLDERSLINSKALFPLEGIEINAIGYGSLGKTDAEGNLYLPELPSNSKLLLTLSDTLGREYHSAVGEVDLSNTEQKQTLFMTSKSSLKLATASTNLSEPDSLQRLNAGSLCGRVLNSKGNPVSEATATLWNTSPTALSGPHYFSPDELLDPEGKQTSSSGRFCFFSIEPGPVSLSLSLNGQEQDFIVTVLAGFHRELRLVINNSSKRLQLAPELSSRYSQISTSSDRTTHYPATKASFTATNNLKEMEQVFSKKWPVYTSSLPIHSTANSCAVLHNQEQDNFSFSNAMYCDLKGSKGDQTTIVPIFPNGFFEDLAWKGPSDFNSEPFHFNPMLGTLYLETLGPEIPENSQIELTRASINQAVAGSSVAISGGGAPKKAYFNLPSDTYVATVKGPDGKILGIRSAPVFAETATILQMGATLLTP